MDLDRIFNLFNNENSSSDDESSLLVDFSEHPLYWIGGFNKIISNHLFFKNYTVKVFGKISSDLDIEELEKAGEDLMFRKAFDYIKSIDLTKPFHVECIKLKANNDFVEHLKESILYFEQFEEYEKCALLKRIEDKVEEFLS